MVMFRVFVASCLLIGAGGSALSQPIDHPNVIGVYFDEAAVSNYMEMGPPVNERIDNEEAQAMLSKYGFTVENYYDLGPTHYGVAAKA